VLWLHLYTPTALLPLRYGIGRLLTEPTVLRTVPSVFARCRPSFHGAGRLLTASVVFSCWLCPHGAGVVHVGARRKVVPGYRCTLYSDIHVTQFLAFGLPTILNRDLRSRFVLDSDWPGARVSFEAASVAMIVVISASCYNYPPLNRDALVPTPLPG
jgi:hypothetical protein